MKHASALAANPNVNEEQAKQIYKSLRKAAGLFKFVQEKYFEKLPDQPAKGSDLDPRVSTAYQMQCLAEAQEGKILIFNLFFFLVNWISQRRSKFTRTIFCCLIWLEFAFFPLVTIARAIELKHQASLISGLCSETSKLFYTACLSLKELDQEKVGKFNKYLNLKATFYEAYVSVQTFSCCKLKLTWTNPPLNRRTVIMRKVYWNKKRLANPSKRCRNARKILNYWENYVKNMRKPKDSASHRDLTSIRSFIDLWRLVKGSKISANERTCWCKYENLLFTLYRTFEVIIVRLIAFIKKFRLKVRLSIRRRHMV